MSCSSDFIRFKKNLVQLKNATTLAKKMVGSVKYPEIMPIMNQQDYINFEQFNLETTTINTKNAYSKLVPSGKQEVFHMVRDITACPTFIMCKNTNTRPNRVLNTGSIGSTGKPVCYKKPLWRVKPTIDKKYNPQTCVFINGYTKRTCPCTKLLCKCGTKVCEQK